MNIGFDAKRAFLNGSGLGNYSRNTIELMSHYFPEHQYNLFTPDDDPTMFNKELLRHPSIHMKTPDNFVDRLFSYNWRTNRIKKELINEGIQLYHGLTNELPVGINKTGIKSIVTIHDLIFLRYPHLYHSIDRFIYNKKIKRALEIADMIISVSEQTKTDIINFYNIKPEKIRVIYQGCNSVYYEETPEESKSVIRMKFDLPSQFLLSVGTVEERKNVLSLIKAIHEYQIDCPLVVVGAIRKKYFDSIRKYLSDHRIRDVYFLENVELHDLHVIYQMASVFVYVSVFEGFGIPIVEALNSKVPVITSIGGCFSEAGGPGSIYIDPKNIEELADSIKKVLHDSSLKQRMVDEGYKHAYNFRQDKIAHNLNHIYCEIIN